jgi:hypothetical protein
MLVVVVFFSPPIPSKQTGLWEGQMLDFIFSFGIMLYQEIQLNTSFLCTPSSPNIPTLKVVVSEGKILLCY